MRREFRRRPRNTGGEPPPDGWIKSRRREIPPPIKLRSLVAPNKKAPPHLCGGNPPALVSFPGETFLRETGQSSRRWDASPVPAFERPDSLPRIQRALGCRP